MARPSYLPPRRQQWRQEIDAWGLRYFINSRIKYQLQQFLSPPIDDGSWPKFLIGLTVVIAIQFAIFIGVIALTITILRALGVLS